MKITLSNGKELYPLVVTGAQHYVQGAQRDVLSFVFSAEESMEELDGIFSPNACESITVTGNDGGLYVYKAYTIRVKLEKTAVEITPATAENEAVTEERITVAMAQRTYTETQLAALELLLTGGN